MGVMDGTQQLLEAMDGLVWLTDPQGRFVTCGWRRWARAARADGAESYAEPDTLIGRSMLDFVEGEPVRDAYARFMDALRQGRTETIGFSFRCDSPGARRRFRMAITRVEEDGTLRALLFQSQRLSERARVPLALFDFAAMRARIEDIAAAPIVEMCSLCQRVAFPPGGATREWVEADEYYRRGGPGEVCVSHTVCPHCEHHVVRRARGGEAPEEGVRP